MNAAPSQSLINLLLESGVPSTEEAAELGTTHQTPHVNATDFAPRYRWRWCYYFKSRDQLIFDPAYVGSMQTALKRRGYYCGPVDGVFTPEVSYAIARLQKNYSMRVTGTLTPPVRRALHMP